MPVPEIDITTSIPMPTVGVPYSYIPYASNNPVASGGVPAWKATTLPPGLAINAVTGEISGTPTTEGVCTFGLIASNADGSSWPPTKITFGINAAAASTSGSHLNPALFGLNCVIDITSGGVAFPGALAATQSSTSGAPEFPAATTVVINGATTIGNTSSASAGASTADTSPTASFLASIIEGDDKLFYVQYQKNGKFFDPGVITSGNLEIVCKEFDPDAPLIIGNAHIKTGAGEDATFVLYVHIDSEELKAALSNYEGDSSTKFTALCQIRWKVPNVTGIGPNPLVQSSQPFGLQIIRNVAP